MSEQQQRYMDRLSTAYAAGQRVELHLPSGGGSSTHSAVREKDRRTVSNWILTKLEDAVAAQEGSATAPTVSRQR